MDSKKSYIPVKVLLSYIVLIALIITVGWMLYSESRVFSDTEDKMAAENNKVLKVGSLLSNMQKTESYARVAMQSNSEENYDRYEAQTELLYLEIDSLKTLIKSDYQCKLLDSIKFLLSKKTANIQQLKVLKNENNDEAAVKSALRNIDNMEGSLRKLRIQDFVKDPSKLQPHQLRVWKKYVDYMNNNIPSDSTNTLTQQALDSMLSASKKALGVVVVETSKRRSSLNAEENKLLQNEMMISEQLRKILSVIEREIITSTAKSNAEKEKALQKTNKMVMYAAIAGFLLTVFFSLLIVSDFSKSQQYKRRLEIANAKTQSLLKSREQLISTVSHDLKTPLSTIVGYAELLGNSDLNRKQSYYTTAIKGSSEYIAKLVQDLLDFTQIESGKIAIETIPFSLQSMIQEVAKSIKSVYESKPIELILEVDSDFEQRILGDPFRLRQILTNIIGNAFKFTADGFIKVKATANPENETITIQIQDSGIGIKKENLGRIFEEFTQADNNIEKKYGGTGLGLTISRKMAEILSGNLQLESIFGTGSTFTITLPLLFDETTLLTENQLPNQMQKKVIVVDDDSNLLQLTAEVLKQKGCTVYPFQNAKHALELIKKTNFDFIITDIQMPEMDGFEFMKSLRENQGTTYNSQPVIAVTGSAELDNDIFKTAGFTTFIRKPYAPTLLFETIHAIFHPQSGIEKKEEISIENDENALYSLASLQSFLPDDNDNALREVLLSFEKVTSENIKDFETAVSKKDVVAAKNTAHKMGPMFRQINANTIGNLLAEIELKDEEMAVIETHFEDVQQKISVLFSQLRKDSVL